jgi:hypothetical protein
MAADFFRPSGNLNIFSALQTKGWRPLLSSRPTQTIRPPHYAIRHLANRVSDRTALCIDGAQYSHPVLHSVG